MPNSPVKTPIPSPSESLEEFLFPKDYLTLKKLTRPWRVRDVWSEDEDGLLERSPSTVPESDLGMPLANANTVCPNSPTTASAKSGVPVPQVNSGDVVDQKSQGQLTSPRARSRVLFLRREWCTSASGEFWRCG